MATAKDTEVKLAEAASTEEMAEALRASGVVDDLLAQVDGGEVTLIGDGGLLPGLIKLALERGLAAELTEHPGLEKGDPVGRELPNARNGHSPKTVQTEAGPVPLDVPRDREPKGPRRLSGLDTAGSSGRGCQVRNPIDAMRRAREGRMPPPEWMRRRIGG